VAVHREGGLVVAIDEALSAANRRVQDLQAELDGIIAAQEADPPDDEHDVEGASVGFERARVTALLAAARRSAEELESAAARRDAGVVLPCETCGGPIGEDRLAALPATRVCVDCARRR
jgi:RNA polymerase-binding transcription factor DksA